MTDRDEALEALRKLKLRADDYVELNLKTEVWDKNKDHNSQCEQIIEAALKPAPDVEGLKKDPSKGLGDRDWMDGWNDCIDHLTSRGVIGGGDG